MHVVSFNLFSSLLFVPALWLLEAAGPIALISLFVVTIWQCVYMTVAIRRFYFAKDRRRFRTGVLAAAMALLIYVLNSAFITAVQLLGGALALSRI